MAVELSISGVEGEKGDILKRIPEGLRADFSQAILSDTSLKAIQDFVEDNQTIDEVLFLELLDYQKRISKLFFAAKQLSELYSDPDYQIGILDMQTHIGWYTQSTSFSDIDSVELEFQGKIQAYQDIYGMYREWMSRKGSYPDVIYGYMETYFDQVLNDFNTVDSEVVIDIDTTIEGINATLSQIEGNFKGEINISSYSLIDSAHYDESPYNTFFVYLSRYYIDAVGEDSYSELADQPLIIDGVMLDEIMKKVSYHYASSTDFPHPLYLTLSDGQEVDIRDYMSFSQPLEITVSPVSPETETETSETSIEKPTPSSLVESVIYHPEFPGTVGKGSPRDTIVTSSLQEALMKVKDAGPKTMKFVAETIKVNLAIGTRKSLDFIKTCVDIGIIDREQAYVYLWGPEGLKKHSPITLSDIIKTFGIPESVNRELAKLMGVDELNDMNIRASTKNLLMMLGVESYGGWNVYHSTRASSAEGPVQALAGDGRFDNKTGVWLKGSFDMMLYRSNKAGMLANFPRLQEVYKTIGPNISMTPKELTPQETMIIYFGSLYGRAPNLFKNMMNGSRQASIDIYAKHHHTNMDNNTVERLTKEVRKVYGDDYIIATSGSGKNKNFTLRRI